MEYILLGLAALTIWLAVRRSLLATPPSAHPMNLPLVAIPTLLGVRVFNVNVALVGLAVICVIALIAGRNVNVRGRSGKGLVALLGFALVVVYIRPTNLTDGLVVAVTAITILASLRRTPGEQAVDSIVDGVGVYLLVNVALHFAGVQSPGYATRLGGLGEADALRVIFPLSNSLNQPPALAALFIGGALLVAWRARPARRLFLLAAAGAAGYVIYAAGSRAPLIAAIVPVVLVLLPPVVRKVAGVAVAVFAVISAWVLPAVIGIAVPLVRWAGDFIPTLFRAGEVTAENALNGRQTIWDTGTHYFFELDGIEQLLGFGQSGQIVSGVSNEYAWIFGRSVADPLGATLHNSFLQQLYDGGWVGFTALAVAAIVGAWRWGAMSERGGLHAMGGLSMLSVGLLLGMSEVSAAPGYGQESFWVVAMLLVAAFQAKQRTPPQPPSFSKVGIEAGSAALPVAR